MTSSEAFRDLPAVYVRMMDGAILSGTTSVSSSKFAKISVIVHKTFLTVGEWTWDCVAECTKDKPLRV